jgi:hypothetical protein
MLVVRQLFPACVEHRKEYLPMSIHPIAGINYFKVLHFIFFNKNFLACDPRYFEVLQSLIEKRPTQDSKILALVKVEKKIKENFNNNPSDLVGYERRF